MRWKAYLTAFALPFAICAVLITRGGVRTEAPGFLARELAAASFAAGRPFVIPVKYDYSLKQDPVHADFRVRPGMPGLIALGRGLGISSASLAAWLAAIFLAACGPAWAWAFEPRLRAPVSKRKKRGAIPREAVFGAFVVLALLLQSGNTLLEDILSGGTAPAGIALLAVAYGACVRGRFRLAGAAGAAAFLFHQGAELAVLALALSHFFFGTGEKAALRARESAWLAWPMVAAAMPFAILGAQPWLGDLAGSFLEGAAARDRWFADSDGGLGHPVYFNPLYVHYEEWARNRWFDQIRPWFGEFLSELAYMSVLAFLGLLYAVRRPAARELVAWLWFLVTASVLVHAGWVSFLDRSRLAQVDALGFAWLALLLLDSDRRFRAAGVALAILVVSVNAPALKGPFQPLSPSGRDDDAVAVAIRLLDPDQAPVLARKLEGRALALRGAGVPMLELPENFGDAGLADLFVDRWKIRWTTAGEQLRPHLKTHGLRQVDAVNGARLWELTRL